jgi:hypothetical protein
MPESEWRSKLARRLVEADGVGGAVLLVVEGNYPVDFYTREEKQFSTEAEAVRAAEALRVEASSV